MPAPCGREPIRPTARDALAPPAPRPVRGRPRRAGRVRPDRRGSGRPPHRRVRWERRDRRPARLQVGRFDHATGIAEHGRRSPSRARPRSSRRGRSPRPPGSRGSQHRAAAHASPEVPQPLFVVVVIAVALPTDAGGPGRAPDVPGCVAPTPVEAAPARGEAGTGGDNRSGGSLSGAAALSPFRHDGRGGRGCEEDVCRIH